MAMTPRMVVWLLVFGATFVCFLGSAMGAAVIGTQAKVHAENRPVDGTSGQTDESGLLTSNQPISASAAVPLASADALASFGVNGLREVSSAADILSSNAFAFSRWADEFIISGGAGTGVATFVVTIHGFISGGTFVEFLLAQTDLTPEIDPVPGLASPCGLFSLVPANQNGACFFLFTGEDSREVNDVVTLSVSFTFNEPFSLTGFLFAQSDRFFIVGTDVADFLSTASLTSIVLPVGATISAASGTPYPITPISINDLVSFAPIASTFKTTTDTSGCPAGFVGKFSFDARLTNISDNSLFGLKINVITLTNNNLLQNADGAPGGVGAILSVPRDDDLADGVLSPEEFVNVPFIICLQQRAPFSFFVNVSGIVGQNNLAAQ